MKDWLLISITVINLSLFYYSNGLALMWNYLVLVLV